MSKNHSSHSSSHSSHGSSHNSHSSSHSSHNSSHSSHSSSHSSHSSGSSHSTSHTSSSSHSSNHSNQNSSGPCSNHSGLDHSCVGQNTSGARGNSSHSHSSLGHTHNSGNGGSSNNHSHISNNHLNAATSHSNSEPMETLDEIVVTASLSEEHYHNQDHGNEHSHHNSPSSAITIHSGFKINTLNQNISGKAIISSNASNDKDKVKIYSYTSNDITYLFYVIEGKKYIYAYFDKNGNCSLVLSRDEQGEICEVYRKDINDRYIIVGLGTDEEILKNFDENKNNGFYKEISLNNFIRGDNHILNESLEEIEKSISNKNVKIMRDENKPINKVKDFISISEGVLAGIVTDEKKYQEVLKQANKLSEAEALKVTTEIKNFFAKRLGIISNTLELAEFTQNVTLGLTNGDWSKVEEQIRKYAAGVVGAETGVVVARLAILAFGNTPFGIFIKAAPIFFPVILSWYASDNDILKVIYERIFLLNENKKIEINGNAIYGANSNEYLKGDEEDDYIFGGDGNDILEGGKGNDILDGGNNIDLYQFNIGDGIDYITDQSLENEIFINRIKEDDNTYFQVNRDFTVLKYSDNDSIIVKNRRELFIGGFYDYKMSVIKGIRYSGGSGRLNLKELYGCVNRLNLKLNFKYNDFVIDGPNKNNHHIYGTNNDNLIVPFFGDDTIEDMMGNDTYFFTKGFGNDIIIDHSGDDHIFFDSYFRCEDLQIRKSGDDLMIGFKNENDSILIKNWSNDDYKIEHIDFEQGKSLDLLEIDKLVNGISTFSASSNGAVLGSLIQNNSFTGLKSTKLNFI